MHEGDRIRKIRQERGMSRRILAEKSGVAEITISQYENKKRRPKAEQLQMIAVALSVSVDTLLGLSAEEDAERTKKLLEEQKKFYEWLTENQDEVDDMPIEKARLLFHFDELNQKGQVEAIKRTEELTQIPKYKASEENE